MAEQTYQRLTRLRGRAGFAIFYRTRCGLWLGADHLLLLQTNGYRETYKRFYFSDIQTITVRKTRHGLALNVILGLGVLATGLAAAGLWLSQPSGWRGPDLAGVLWLVGLPLAALLGSLLANWLAGPTCRVSLRSAVQTEDLPPLRRLRQADKFINRLRPLISAAQGEISGDDAAARIQAALRAHRPDATAAAGAAADPPPTA